MLELAGVGEIGLAPEGHTDPGAIIREAVRARRSGSYDRLMEDLEGGPVTEAEIAAVLDGVDPRAFDPGPASPNVDKGG